MNQVKKNRIAKCLIEAIQTKIAVDEETCKFICDWIYTGEEAKNKEHFEVWEMVLKNYYPIDRPILFRATDFINDGKIESYTGRLFTARKFLRQCGEEGKLIICETSESIMPKEYEVQGNFRHTFFPLSKLLKNEMRIEESHFNKKFIEAYIGEDEYIMRTEIDYMFIYKKIN